MNNKIYPFEYVVTDEISEAPNDTSLESKETQEISEGMFVNSLFLKRVGEILDNDIKSINSIGCRIDECHTHIGSKKHLTQFIEAELLFKNSYYIKGFAYLAAQKIQRRIGDCKKVCLVGYENISEMYLIEIKELLKDRYNIEYAVFNNTSFSFSTDENWFKNLENALVVFSVPISTTMTTMDKIIQKFEDNGYKVSNRIIRLAIIVIAPLETGNQRLENDSWYIDSNNRIHVTKKQYYSKITENDVIDCFVNISKNIKWFEPNKCPACFPDRYGTGKESIVDERALFEVNKESTVPMLQLFKKSRRRYETDDTENRSRVLALLKHLETCRHIIRNNNHFQFYFNTKSFFEQICRESELQKDFISWCRKIKENLPRESSTKRVYYDVIVTPKHFSNAEFVHTINSEVFDGNARLLVFDVYKEFRENVKLKYSDLSALSEYMKRNENSTVLRFHYVDDSITSGDSYHKIKSWLISLLPTSAVEYRNDIFSSIIVLLGRNSIGSKNAYVGENYSFKGNSKWMNPEGEVRFYYEYVHFNVSTMRNHEDACTLCKVKTNNDKVAKNCATNVMYKRMEGSVRKNETSPFGMENQTLQQNPNGVMGEDKAKQHRLIAIILHDLNTSLESPSLFFPERKDFDPNDPKIIRDALLKMFKQNKPYTKEHYECIDGYNKDDFVVALIKAISRPFFTYGKSYRQAALSFCLEKLDDLLKKKNIRQSDKKLMEVYINALSDMNSAYLLREQTVVNMLNNDSEVFLTYAAAVKRMLSLSTDDSKGELFECILVKGTENAFFNSINDTKDDNSADIIRRALLYLENNKVLADGLEESRRLYEKAHGAFGENDTVDIEMTRGIASDLSKLYYMRGFMRFFEINGINDIQDRERILNNYLTVYNYLQSGNSNDFVSILNKLARPIGELICSTTVHKEDLRVDVFLVDAVKKEADNDFNEGLYGFSEKKTDETFYSGKNLKKMLGIVNCLSEDAPLYYKDGVLVMCVGITDALYVSIQGINRSFASLREWFGIKVFLTMRESITSFLKNYDMKDEIQKIEIEKKTKALNIRKAFSHGVIEYFEGEDFPRNLVDCLHKEYSDDQTKTKEYSGFLKESNDRHLMKVANDFISTIYREMIDDSLLDGCDPYVLYSNKGTDYWKAILKDTCGFEENPDNGYLIHEVDTPADGEHPRIKIVCKPVPKDKGKVSLRYYFKTQCGSGTIPVFCRLIYVLAANSGQHCVGFTEKDAITFEVEIKNNLLVFQNDIFSASYKGNDKEYRIEKIKSEIEKKVDVLPWETESPSITLWTLKRYFDLVKKKKKETKEEEAESDLNWKIEDGRFIIELPIVEYEGRRQK